MKLSLFKAFSTCVANCLFALMCIGGLLITEESQGQAYTISYTGLTGNVAASGVPTGITNTTPYTGVTASCVTSSNGATTSYSTVLTAAAGYNFTVTSVNGTAYASSAGSKSFTFQISSNNGDFTTTQSAATIIGTSSSCGGSAALTALTGTFTVLSGRSVTITVLRAAGGATGGGYSFTKTLNIAGVVSVAATAPGVTTSAATAITATGATLNGLATANGASTTVNFNYGLTTSYGTTIAATQSPVAIGSSNTAVSRAVSGLSPNTFYNFRVSGTNTAGTTNGGNFTFYTLANVPVAPVVSNPSLSTLDVTIGTGDGNSAATIYAIQEAGGQYVQANGSLGASPVYQTAAAWGTKTITGLAFSTTYTFKVIARNGASVNTAFGPTTSGTTLTPTNPIATLSVAQPLTEVSLDGSQFTITLQNASFTASGSLNASSFILNNAPPSSYILGVTVTGTTTAIVTLGYDGEDFDVNSNDFSITIPAAVLSSNQNLVSGVLPVTAFVETITLTGTVGNLGSVCTGNASSIVSYSVSGTGLKDNITLLPPADFELSLSNSPFIAVTEPIVLSMDENGAVAATIIYVRFKPSGTGATGDQLINHSSFGAEDKNMIASGTGIFDAPTVTSPASSAVTLTGASLSGNISFAGCTEVTERGIYWSTVNGFADGEGTKVSETGSFTAGVFSQTVPGLPVNSTIYFKAFVTNSIGTAYSAQGTFNTLKTEPSQYVTGFACGTVAALSIPLSWTDASGEVAADGYLVKWSAAGYDAITAPVDGSTVNGANAVTVNPGAQAVNVTGLSSNTTYYFKIFSYTNSGSNIDYKTDAVVPQTSCTTLTVPCNTAATTVAWNFTDGTANANSVPSNLTVDPLTQGNNNGTTALVTAVSAGSGYTGASGTNNAGAAARVGVLSLSTSAYFQFGLTPAAGYNVTLTGISFGSRSTSTGPQAYAIRSSLDNYATDIATGALSNGGTWQLISNTGLNAVSAAATPVSFRIFGYNGAGSATAGTANWRIDDITLNVTVSNGPSAAVAGATQNVCGTLTSNTLGGNTPAMGTGIWSQVSGPGNTVFSSVNSGAATATATATGSYVYKWSISNGCATVNAANITVNYVTPPTASVAGNNGPVCSGTTGSFTLNGTNTAVVSYTINGTPGTVSITGGIGTIDVSNVTTNQTLTLVSAAIGSCSQAISGSSLITLARMWTGGTGNWSAAANWCGNVLPSAGDEIVVESGNPQLDVDFTVNGKLTVKGTGSLTVNPAKTLAVGTAGTIDLGNRPVTLRSTADGTAAVGKVEGALTGATNVTVERYVPGNSFRSWRLLSIPTYGSGQTIRQAWQEGDANPAPKDNNVEGYGTQITAPFATQAAAAAAGFDSTSAQGSLLRYSGPGWSNITNTNQPINNFNSYFLYIRGDRSQSVSNATTNPTATTLRTRGTIYTGDQVFNIAENTMALIPNLYPSAISFAGLERTGGINNLFYIWDSKKLNGVSLGMYQTFSGTNGYNCLISGGSYVLGQPNTIIESGQSFFVQTTAAGVLTLNENSKVASGGSLGFRPINTGSKIDASLYNGQKEMLDANAVVFNNAYSNAVGTEDAPKMGNPGANFAIETGSKLLAIEGAAPVQDGDVIQYRLWNLTEGDYSIGLVVNEMNLADGVSAILEDTYLGTKTIVNTAGTTTLNFAITKEVTSAAANRFRLVFSKAQPAVSVAGFTIAPNPVVNSIVNVKLNNKQAGRYPVALVNGKGQIVFSAIINHTGATASYQLHLPETVMNGLYHLKIVSKDKEEVQPVLISSK